MDELPVRPSRRPTTTASNPHMQLDQNAPPALVAALARRAFALPEVQERRSLVSVPGARALCLLTANGPPEAFLIDREFAHFHPPPDGSLHLALPVRDALGAIFAGWAERHPLAASGSIPETIVMVYGPRDEQEVEIVWSILLSSYRFARNGE